MRSLSPKMGGASTHLTLPQKLVQFKGNRSLYRKGLVDEEDLALLRSKLIELPRQMGAERAELIRGAIEKDKEEQLVKDIPDTLH